MKTPNPKPRNPWPIAIVIYFIFFGSLVVSFTVFALQQKTDLVTPDYYADEIQFQQQIDRVGRTQTMPGKVAVEYRPGNRQITIALPAEHRNAVGLIRLYRPSDAGADLQLKLAPDANGAQALDASRLRPGLWKVRVQWKWNGDEYFFDRSIVVEANPRS